MPRISRNRLAVKAIPVVAAAGLMAMPALAAGQSMEEKMQALEAQMQALQAQLEELKRAQAAQQAQATQPAPAQAAQTSKQPAQEQAALKVDAKGAPRFSGEGFKNFKLRGRVMADFGHVSGAGQLNDPGLGTTTEIRRARIGVEGGFAAFSYRIEADFADNDVAMADAYVRWRNGDFDVTVGNQRAPFSMEEMTSSLHSAFLERAGFTDSFGFDREIGVTLTWSGDHYGLSGGVYSDARLSGDDEANGYLVSGRGHYVFDVGEGWAMLGASAMHRASGAAPTRYRNRPLIHTTDTRFISATTNASSDTLWGVETAGAWGPFWAAAEWAWARADLPAPLAAGLDAKYQADGGYVHAGWYITGEARGFNKGKGIWSSTTPRRALSEGGFGAFALALGWEDNDLSDQGAGVIGGRQTGYLASLTWIPETHVRFIAQYALVEVDDRFPDLDGNGHVDVFGLRTQVSW
ncbi:MAG: hypothetical protein Tsb0016_15430 [Sphingomonadales bacterium]